jgi:hypothetical protein
MNSSPTFNPSSPSYEPSSPTNNPTSPSYSPKSPSNISAVDSGLVSAKLQSMRNIEREKIRSQTSEMSDWESDKDERRPQDKHQNQSSDVKSGYQMKMKKTKDRNGTPQWRVVSRGKLAFSSDSTSYSVAATPAHLLDPFWISQLKLLQVKATSHSTKISARC